MPDKQTLVITTGEPSGIGIEVSLKAVTQLLSGPSDNQFVLLGDFTWIDSISQRLDLAVELNRINQLAQAKASCLNIFHIPLSEPATLGTLNSANSNYVIQQLLTAHQWAINQQVAAIITAPVHKGVINDAGFSFTGHTEFFAEKAAVKQVVMMLASDKLKVALVTTHLPLNQVSKTINAELLASVFDICHRGLGQLGIKKPTIKVLGLNPHAGEQGHLGTEELTIIEPAIARFNQQHQDQSLQGPFPADTVYSPSNLANTDLFLAMYHDQGLPVIKFASFGQSANVTLGLPYIRTSVDHGTANNIADSLVANADSMLYAIKFALRAINRRHFEREGIL
ncbi:MAG: 4-hydroxythreonine-4-phosphate dehydrogenase PdxA [Kangiellaceae bacterium]|jgi:4-hydroxythreonine-4-phosphate dehydrogenase|nr:4-hydroxythreonine-4-phosphate dehydrogenase PdxA [Kangiellaceae bacterium]